MIRTQIQLTEVQSARLREAARRSGVSAAEIIRRSIDRFLEQEATAPPIAATRLAALQVVGRFHSGVSDIAERHDDYLSDIYLPPAES
jgi:hypothetical protein